MTNVGSSSSASEQGDEERADALGRIDSRERAGEPLPGDEEDVVLDDADVEVVDPDVIESHELRPGPNG